ncbi:TIGR03085 family metal-binding protein [Aciditerrimonas ferrireducens]|uniref:TIGR03085 family metal-binding protein n=1 Tax=Aciditerrimonas ferrireducens TaxID=667306 RepID=A0ABV6C191_9ACTN
MSRSATSPPSRTERRALARLLAERGPDAPTLCEGWLTRDLAVHLVVRERRPLAAPGILLGGPARRLLERATTEVRQLPYDDLVALVESGPPAWLAPLDPRVNLAEFFVHHEDVRRAGPEALPPRPAEETRALDEALWGLLGVAGRLLVRRAGGLGIALRRPDGQQRVLRPGTPTVVLQGRPSELTLYLYGRQAVAQVEPTGEPEALARLAQVSFGL